MKKIDLPLILDILFYSSAGWVFTLVVMRYYRLPSGICFTVASLLALALGGTLFLIIGGRHRRLLLNKRQQREKEDLMLHLALEKDERVRALLLTAFRADGKEAHCEKDALSVDGQPVVPLFTMQPVSADAVARLLREYGEEKFLLLCNDLSPEAERLMNTFGRAHRKGEEIYALLLRTETYPAALISGELPRRNLKTKFVRSFSKKNARPFFVSGLLLMLMSLFTFFPKYYLITGGILLSSSVVIRAFGYA